MRRADGVWGNKVLSVLHADCGTAWGFGLFSGYFRVFQNILGRCPKAEHGEMDEMALRKQAQNIAGHSVTRVPGWGWGCIHHPP